MGAANYASVPDLITDSELSENTIKDNFFKNSILQGRVPKVAKALIKKYDEGDFSYKIQFCKAEYQKYKKHFLENAMKRIFL